MFRLRVLGGFALDGTSGAAAPVFPKRRAEAVLAVLAVCGDLGCTRERLLALLWPESDDASARHGLRDALHVIRRSLGPGAVPSAGRLLRLDPAVVASDILQFSQALSTGRPADAVRLYAGPLLDGFHVDDAAEFERWLDGERVRLAREYGEALKQLATAAEAAGAWGEAGGWWARAVEQDSLNSHLVLHQMRVLAAMGDRANAIRVAEGHVRRFREEFDLERFEAARQDRHDSGPTYWRARMLARVGETDAALTLIERLLAGPSLFSVHELRLNPDFDLIRGDSRYHALVRKYGG